MLTLLLVIIYLSFISLGLPDALLGSAWPVMNLSLGVPVSFAGILSMIVTGGTILSSVFSDRMVRRFGAGKITFASVAVTAVALLGYSLSGGFWMLCLMAVPLGLGAGAVDAALNNFVSLHYKARHMNWLHCFWGIGATLGPYIMSLYLRGDGRWASGYRTVSLIQFGLVAVLLFTLPLWKKVEQREQEETQADGRSLSIGEVLRLPLAKETLFTFFCYCSIETTTGLWGSTFLVESKGFPAGTAARWVSLYYLGITAGRFLSGFVSVKLGNRDMVRCGMLSIGIGALLLAAAPLPLFCLIGLICIGLGCAPIFPSLLHSTPDRFGKNNAQSVMGIQMACAYVGSTVMPPLFGFLAGRFSASLFPFYILAVFFVFLYANEKANRDEKRLAHTDQS